MLNRRMAIQTYLDAYEKDAHFNAYGNDDLAFAPDDLSATGYVTPANIAKPYIIGIVNASAASTTVVLFGANRNLFNTTATGVFGNASTTTVTVNGTADGYAQLLMQSQNQPFDIIKWRISCSTAGQLDQEITPV